MQQAWSSLLLKLVFKAGKQWVPFLLSIFLVAQTASLLMTCARSIFSARASYPVWLDHKYYKDSVPRGFCLPSCSVCPCRVYDIEWNVDVVYWSKFARQGPPVATGNGQQSNPADGEVLHPMYFEFWDYTYDLGCWIFTGRMIYT